MIDTNLFQFILVDIIFLPNNSTTRSSENSTLPKCAASLLKSFTTESVQVSGESAAPCGIGWSSRYPTTDECCCRSEKPNVERKWKSVIKNS